MRVYLIRHGETTGNRDNIHQGWGNVALTEKGEAQARGLGMALERSGIVFRRYISSDVHRVRQTASIVFPALTEGDYEFDPRLREIDNNSVAGQRGDDLLAKYGPEYTANTMLLDYSAYGGESVASMLKRTAAFLEDLRDEQAGGGNIAVLTHGGVIHAILSQVLDMRLYLPKLRIDNCSLTRLTLGGKTGLWSADYINLRVDAQGFSPRL